MKRSSILICLSAFVILAIVILYGIFGGGKEALPTGDALSIERTDSITLNSPIPGEEVTSPLHIEGEAEDGWFYEGSFVVEIYDANEAILGAGPVIAVYKEKLENEKRRYFEGVIPFDNPVTRIGKILLIRGSGDIGESDRETDRVSVPVVFEQSYKSGLCDREACIKNFCSAVGPTACEPHESDRCFEGASCELKRNGTCGWKETEELRACLRELEK